MTVELAVFAPWIERWGLTPDGEPFLTDYAQSRLLPVRAGSVAAMLKLALSDDERRGARVMAWWDGEGAAPVLAHDETALLMVRAAAPTSLAALAMAGHDDEATTVAADVVAQLHAPRATAPPRSLPPLPALFQALRASAEPRLEAPARVAASLLEDPIDPVVLHGDVHHGNILNFGAAGWLAIDPWGYLGERAYDYANLHRNPDLALVTAPGRLLRQLALTSARAAVDPERLLRWVFAHAGLAAAWEIADGHDPARSLAVLDIAGAAILAARGPA